MTRYRNYRVHLVYLDSVNALIGNYHWRYETMERNEMYGHVLELSKKGMSEFRYRELGVPYSEWVAVSPDTARAWLSLSFR